MFTGAIASSYYGVPRTTIYVDIIVAISELEQSVLVSALKEIGLLVSVQDFKNAYDSGYNIVSVPDQHTPFTVDFILLDASMEKNPCTLFGEPTYLQTSENLVRAKLRIIKATLDPEKSAKDKQDIRAIIRYSGLDMNKIRNYAITDETIDILTSLFG